MPELPEVETIKLGLQKYLVGHKIIDIEVKLKKMLQGDTRLIIGSKVKGVRRFGKGLVIDLDNGFSLAIHIKLTGQLIYRGPNAPKDIHLSQEKVGSVPNRWTHIIFHLDKSGILYYNDLRQFGWVKIVKTEQVSNLPFFKELGPEPPVLKKDGLTLELFKAILGKAKKVPVKSLLMDQKRIGGVGNIYANEALFVAGIDPRRKASSLNEKEKDNLYKTILEVLRRGLKERGATELNFVDALGQEGGYQRHFLVYSREGKACRNGNGIIKKIKLAGRGTYFCTSCQR